MTDDPDWFPWPSLEIGPWSNNQAWAWRIVSDLPPAEQKAFFEAMHDLPAIADPT